MSIKDDDIARWLKRASRKGPFYLYATEEIVYTAMPSFEKRSGWLRRVIWREGEKTKIGTLEDGMCCRYGIKTYGALTGTKSTGLWQASPNSVTDSELRAMIAVAASKTTLEPFDLSRLHDLAL